MANVLHQYHIISSPVKNKKLRVITPSGTKIDFGGDADYTVHRDDTRKYQYLRSHERRENWDLSGINTAGFWSRWILWNKPTIEESIQDLQDKYGLNITYRTYNEPIIGARRRFPSPLRLASPPHLVSPPRLVSPRRIPFPLRLII